MWMRGACGWDGLRHLKSLDGKFGPFKTPSPCNIRIIQRVQTKILLSFPSPAHTQPAQVASVPGLPPALVSHVRTSTSSSFPVPFIKGRVIANSFPNKLAIFLCKMKTDPFVLCFKNIQWFSCFQVRSTQPLTQQWRLVDPLPKLGFPTFLG